MKSDDMFDKDRKENGEMKVQLSNVVTIKKKIHTQKLILQWMYFGLQN